MIPIPSTGYVYKRIKASGTGGTGQTLKIATEISIKITG
jgi:hypothetical protein